ncbi:cation:proton antiporter [Micropruina sp.]|uniref:cation:proton antiporter n=1 Tax=Micropruina sp. TaxID=2737536 RepID=UPI0039E54D7F
MNPVLVVSLITLGLLCIAGISGLSNLTRVAAPLLLVVLGALVGFLPGVPEFEIEPEWVLIGVLPPLLFSSAVSMPSMNFRRELRSIAGLSITLVLVSSLALGWFFSVTLNTSFAWGVALGAIVSPTDAVATAIARRVGVPHRVLTMLEGESLLNDATALVLLRSAVAAAAGTVALGSVLVDFLWALGVAALIGFAAGWLNLWLRARTSDPTVSTLISYAAPFLAAVPAEEVGASGLVAAVIAGLVCGYAAPRMLTPHARLSDSQNWKTVELVLESGIFLLMGLQLHALINDGSHAPGALATILWVATTGWLLTVLIRSGYVITLVQSATRRTARQQNRQQRFDDLERYIAARTAHPEHDPAELRQQILGDVASPPGWLRRLRLGLRRPVFEGADQQARERWNAERIDRLRTMMRRQRATVDYLVSQPIGAREGGLLAWAGMRGAVSLAAAQTLPTTTPSRPALLLVAFFLAGGSLLIQGLTLPLVVKRLSPPPTADDVQAEHDERERLLGFMKQVAEHERARVPGRPQKRLQLDLLAAQRAALLDARDDGVFDARMLAQAMAVVDAEEMSLQLRGSPEQG